MLKFTPSSKDKSLTYAITTLLVITLIIEEFFLDFNFIKQISSIGISIAILFSISCIIQAHKQNSFVLFMDSILGFLSWCFIAMGCKLITLILIGSAVYLDLFINDLTPLGNELPNLNFESILGVCEIISKVLHKISNNFCICYSLTLLGIVFLQYSFFPQKTFQNNESMSEEQKTNDKYKISEETRRD